MLIFFTRLPQADVVESGIINLVLWIRLCIEILSVLIILVGIAVTSYKVWRLLAKPGSEVYNQVRFIFSRYLIMGLEFQLAADIIGTAVSPSWDQLGKLAVIATIRTLLSFFLQYEMREERPAGAGINEKPHDARQTP